MNTPVDVLAVMDKAREAAEAHAHRYMDGKVRVQNIIEARAAFAELIEAVDNVAQREDQAKRMTGGYGHVVSAEHMEELWTARLRVGGAK